MRLRQTSPRGPNRARSKSPAREPRPATRATPQHRKTNPLPRLITLCILFFAVARVVLVLTKPSFGAPDDELYISRLRLPDDPASPTPDFDSLLVCMPTVSRPGRAEYVSNAVKSFRVATSSSCSRQPSLTGSSGRHCPSSSHRCRRPHRSQTGSTRTGRRQTGPHTPPAS